MSRGTRPKILLALALGAGPLSVLLCALLLAWHAPAFAHRGLSLAGSAEAWGALWLCLVLAAAAHLVSVPLGLGLFCAALVRRRPVGTGLALAFAYDVLIGLPLGYWLLAG